MGSECVSGLVSLVIAVSGHKDLYQEDSEDIAQNIAMLLKDQSEQYPQTPILVLTGMAEGADRLAIAAVERLRAEGNQRISYMPVLPMPRDSFIEELKSPENRQQFDRLVSGRVIVELPVHEKFTLNQIRVENSAERNQQYVDLAEFLACTSQILIAVWNGHDTGLPGGTSDLVKRKLGKLRLGGGPFRQDGRHDNQSEASYGLTPNSFGTGPVFHITARRQSQPDGSPEARESVETPDGTSIRDFEEIYLLLNEYNRDVLENQTQARRAEERGS